MKQSKKNSTSFPHKKNSFRRWRHAWESLFLITPSVAFAANYNVANSTDLANAINSVNAGSGNDTITLTGNITLSSLLPALTQSVTVQGQNYSISGNNSYRIFTVDSGQLTVVNASLINGTAVGATGGTGGSVPVDNGEGAGGGGGAGYSNGAISNGGNGASPSGTTWPSGGGAGTNGGNGGSKSNGGSTSAFGAGGGGGAGGSTTTPGGYSGYFSFGGGSGGFGGGAGGAGGGGGWNEIKGTYYADGGAGGGGGGSAGVGGAILVQGGSINLQNVTMTGDSAVGGNGGAGGSISDNTDYGSGGSGGNGGYGLGGALFVNSGTTATITNGSIGSNSATGGSGGAGGVNTNYGYDGYNGGGGVGVGQDAYLAGGTLNYEVDSGTISAQIDSTLAKSTLTKTGSGTLTLTAPFAGSFNLNLNGGTVSLGASGTVGTSGSTISFGGGTLQFTGADTLDYSSEFSTASNQAYSLDTNGYTITLASNLTSSGGSLNKVGTGTLVLTGTNTYNGATTNSSAGTIEIGSGGTSGTLGSGAITNYGTLEFNLSSDTILNSAMSGTGSLYLQGSGSVTLAGTNYAGGTTVNAGTLAVGAGTSLSLLPTGGSLYVGYVGSTTPQMQISNGGQVSDNYAYIGSPFTLHRRAASPLAASIPMEPHPLGTIPISTLDMNQQVHLTSKTVLRFPIYPDMSDYMQEARQQLMALTVTEPLQPGKIPTIFMWGTMAQEEP